MIEISLTVIAGKGKTKCFGKLSWENTGCIWIKRADMCTNNINVFVLIKCAVDEDIFSGTHSSSLFPWWSWLRHSVSVCILNGVYTYKQLYLESHGGTVDLSFMNIRSHGHSSVGTHTHSCVKPSRLKTLLQCISKNVTVDGAAERILVPCLICFPFRDGLPLLCLWLALTRTAFSNYHTSHLNPAKQQTVSQSEGRLSFVGLSS